MTTEANAVQAAYVRQIEQQYTHLVEAYLMATAGPPEARAASQEKADARFTLATRLAREARDRAVQLLRAPAPTEPT